METWTSRDTDQVVQYLGGLCSDRNSANETWMRLHGGDVDRLWRNVMLWCLKYRKKQALLLLLATLKGRNYRPPRYAVSDSLNFVARHFLFGVPNPDPMAVDAIWLLTRKFIEGASDQEQNFTVPQHLLYLVLQHVDDSRVLSFFWLLGMNKAVLHADTMLHFLNRFLDMGRINLSMRLLRTIVNTKYNLSLDQVQMGCIKLLRARFDPATQYTIRSNILLQILEMGIRPQIRMFNTILLNACEGDDFANAWQMYALAKENGLVPDSVTYNVLLKGADLSRDLSNVNLVMREIEANPGVANDLRLLSNMFKATYLTSPGDEFGAMLDLYKKHCDLRPLKELSLYGSETQVLPSAGLQPNHYILGPMILAYVRRHQGSLGLIHSYNLYYQHVKENHPLIAPIAQYDKVANAFIIAFGKRAETLPHCITVVRHMLELSSQGHATSDTTAYSAPTVDTWSLLVAAYLRNRQNRAADKVLAMMRERGIHNNHVTWNTLISYYSGMQDVDATVTAVKGMEAAGFEADAYTAKALTKSRARDQFDQLMTALKSNLNEVPPANKVLAGYLPPLGPEEQYEARQSLEWESDNMERQNEVRRYLEAKNEEALRVKSESRSKSLVTVA